MPLDEKDRERLIQRIYAAFRGVTRDGGISWTETGVIDDYGTDEERARARLEDTDRSWEELVDDPRWGPDTGWGGYSFLDAIGFRYYLAPAMVRAVRSGQDTGIRFHLTLPPPGEEGREYQLGRWRLFDDRQRACIASFLAFMAEWSDQNGWDVEAGWWREALGSYWSTAK